MSMIDIARMTPRERLDLIGEIWDSLTAEDVLLSPAQAAELCERMATFDRDIETAVPWTEVDANLNPHLR